MTDPIRIATIKDKFFCLLDTKRILDGPFPDADSAIRAREELETGPPRKYAEITIAKGLDVNMDIAPAQERGVDLRLEPGADVWLCVDGQPHSSYATIESAESARQKIELGHEPLMRFWRTSTGIGDVIALAGAAVVLSEREGSITLPTKRQYMTSVRSIFADHPNITLVDADIFCKSPEPNNLLIRYDSLYLYDTHLDQFERVYKHFGVDFRHRWDSSPVRAACEKVEQIPVPEGEYVFCHDDRTRGYVIDRSKWLPQNLPVYHPDGILEDNILAFRDLMEGATRGDYIDSAFFNFVECLNPVRKLYLHRYARKTFMSVANQYRTKHPWSVLI